MASMSQTSLASTHNYNRPPPFYSTSAFSSAYSLGGTRLSTPFFRSRRITRQDVQDKVPFHKTDRGVKSLRISYWIFVGVFLCTLAGSVMLFVETYWSVPKHKYCLVLNEQFDGTSLDLSTWTRQVQVDGYGNNEFEWTTDSDTNSYVEDGKLYIVPTYTADSIGEDNVVGNYTVTLGSDCTSADQADCTIISNGDTIIPPIQSARLMTNFSAAIRFGRVEVSVKSAQGDWLWPAVWMMPKDSVYGVWPRSGEIDIYETKGNAVTRWTDRFVNAVSSTLHFGPHWSLDRYGNTTNTMVRKRTYYDEGYTKFGLEWDSKGLYTWQGSRAKPILDVKFNKPFWNRGDFAGALFNGQPFSNPWASSSLPNAAPFDQEFYLIISLAVGGTNGYFPDSPTKPWSNYGKYPARDFWEARDKWNSTWPSDLKQRAMSVDYVKMWRIAEPGEVCEE
ncbi:concanavalin A-like lectin/glucanase [Meredithblackwellia eburnea MCA 4105]